MSQDSTCHKTPQCDVPEISLGHHNVGWALESCHKIPLIRLYRNVGWEYAFEVVMTHDEYKIFQTFLPDSCIK